MTPLHRATRLVSMDRRELRFRLACEARKMVGRLRFEVSPPTHRRSRIANVLDPAAGALVAAAADAARRGDVQAAHAALARHFRIRASRWPLQAAGRPVLVEAIRREFPDATRDAARRADRIIEGRHDLLGFRGLVVGNPPDWHTDVVHRRRAPLDYWSRIPFLDPSIGDHKIIWETNRHQYWLALGTAYWLTGERRYRDAAVAHLEDWIRRNPPLTGVNWASMLELAFRTLSWTWAVEFFCDDAESDGTPWLVDLLLSMDRQLTHVRENLSTYFSPNTHISGEGLALYAVSTAFPELRRSPARAAHGRTILLDEAARQVRADGGHAELSSYYHRYSTDFYLLALLVARAAGDTAAAAFEDITRRQATYLRTISDDRGNLPMIGDDDGGQLFRFGDGRSDNAAATLGVAAAVLGDATLAVGAPTADEYWILGHRPEEISRRGGTWPSRVLPDSGYFVSRGAGGSHLIFDAGPHGFLNGGHAHADALSVVLRVNGEPVFIDPGTGTYTMDPAVRDRFRSSRMHNTLVLDGRDHVRPRGAFQWEARADARLLVARTSGRFDFAAGTHDAYAPHRHIRAILVLHDVGWLVVDRVTGPGTIAAETWWHVHPSWQPILLDHRCELRGPAGQRLAFASTATDLAVVEEALGFAPEYGRIEPGVAIRAGRVDEGACLLAAFVPAAPPFTDGPAISEIGGAECAPGWTAARFHIHAGQSDLQVTIPFPDDSEAEPPPENWPQPCIEQLQTSCVE